MMRIRPLNVALTALSVLFPSLALAEPLPAAGAITPTSGVSIPKPVVSDADGGPAVALKPKAVPVHVAPFSEIGIALKVGVAGPGIDIATPLASRVNLRVGGSFFSYSPSFTVSGITVNGSIDFRSANASLDIYPFGGAFRISPGVNFYNGNKASGVATIGVGQSFTLNDVNYFSSPTAPVTGTFNMAFGNQVAPSLTIGFGNMLPRKASQRWSVPFEIGAQYIGDPLITLNLTGTACANVQGTTGCAPVATDATTKANLKAEQATLNNDINPLKFYPILSIGISRRFGGPKAK